MRKTRDGEDTRQRVLTASQMQFAKSGYSGTSLAMISKQSGISEGLILYHFKNKRNIYQQVLESLADEYAQVLIQARDSADSPLDMIRETLKASFNFWKQDLTYQRISMWAYLEGEAEYIEKETALTAGLVKLVAQLQQQRILDDHLSPPVLLTMIIGPIHYWMRYRDQFKAALDLTETSDELDALFITQLTQLVMRLSQDNE